MSEYSFTPVAEEKPLKYINRLQEIKRAICTLDESITPSKRVGNKSIGLSPILSTPYQDHSARNTSTLGLLDHQNILTPLRASVLDPVRELSQSHISVSESFLQNSEVANNVKTTTAGSNLVKGFCGSYKDGAVDDVLSVVESYAEQCAELHTTLKAMLPSVRHSKTLSQQIHTACANTTHERYTWKLIGAIYQNKLNDASMVEELGEGDANVISALYSRDETIRHAQVVLDWLQCNSAELIPDLPTKVGYFSGKVSWENTFHSLCNGSTKKTVSSMDPDAPIREGKPLSELDAEDQDRLIKHVFALVRAGQVEEAQALCISAGQCWRAAALDGWRLHNDPNYVNTDVREPIEGNAARGLWKRCCWEMCSSPYISAEERALYGALSGNLSALLPVCNTWHHLLWAHIKVHLDQCIEKELCEATGSDNLIPPSYWVKTLDMHHIIDTMAGHKQSSLLHHKLQLAFIAGDLTQALDTITSHLPTADLSERRFLCHLMMVLEILHPGLSCDTLNESLTCYIKSLKEEAHYEELVYYASQLPPQLQIAVLSDVLSDLQDELRVQCVEMALQSDIPISEVTMKIFLSLISDNSPSNTGTVSVANLSDTDAKIVDAVSWLLIIDKQRADALIQANRLMRRFLGSRKHAAAQAIFDIIPPNTIELVHSEWGKLYHDTPLPPDYTNAVREYLCLQAYLDTHQAYNDWCSHSHNRPGSPAPDSGNTFSEQVAHEEKEKSHRLAVQRWEQNLMVQTQLTRDKLLNVLLFIDGGWLVDEEQGTEEGRAEQLHALRCQCIPSTAFLLLNLLSESGQYKRCVELCDYIASEQHGLYPLFTPKELRDLLDKVYDSSLLLQCDPLDFNNETSQ